MSFEMQRAFYATDLPPTARFVAVTLAWHHNAETGRCDPSVALLSRETGLCERAVHKALRALESAGAISVVRRTGATPLYRLNPCTTCTPAPDAPLHHMHPTPALDAPPPLHHVHPPPAPRAPKQERTTISTGREPESTPPAAKEGEFQLEVKPTKEKRPKPGPEPEACATTLPGKPSVELMEAWGEWQQYRQRRAIAPGRQRVAWTAQAARLSAKQVTQYAASHGDRLVCDRIASAINGEWQGLNLDKLDAQAYKPGGKMSREEEARIFKPNPKSINGW